MVGSRRWLTCVVMVLASQVLLAGPVGAQGTLQNLRSEVRRPSKSSKKKVHLADQRQDDDENRWGGLGDLLGFSLLAGLVAPFVGPPQLLGDDYSMLGYFPEYPYEADG